MKVKMTRKDLGGGAVQFGYCEAQDILHYKNPVGYNCGIYGWNWDCYLTHGIVINTGYRNTTGIRARDIDGVDDLLEIAHMVQDDWGATYYEREAAMDYLLEELAVLVKRAYREA